VFVAGCLFIERLDQLPQTIRTFVLLMNPPHELVHLSLNRRRKMGREAFGVHAATVLTWPDVASPPTARRR
jgi:hypothetical protein